MRRPGSGAATAGDLQGGVELVQVPAQPILGAGSVGDQDPTMVDDELDLPARPIELGDRQVSKLEPS